MIIGINARILMTKHIRGWSRYTYNLIHGLHQSGIKLKLFSDQPIEKQWVPKELHKEIYIQSGLNYVHWEQFVLAKMAIDHKVDILHCPTNYGLPLIGNFKKVLTIHDAIEKSYYDQFKPLSEKLSAAHLKIRALHYLSQAAADRIITVSEYSKKDIAQSYGVRSDKIGVIYEGAEDNFNAQNLMTQTSFSQKYGIQPGYYFYIGGLEKRKNIRSLIETARMLESKGFRFVIAGGESEELKKTAPVNVKFLGFVDESDLPSLYHYSRAFFYPSFCEGFGLQLVESMKMGRPAVYSNSTCLGEIYGTGEFGFDPNSVESAVQAVLKLESSYDKAVAYAKERIGFFSWNKSIAQTIELYKSL